VRLNIVCFPGTRTPPQAREVLQELARRLSPESLQVQLVLADDAYLRRLNRTFRRRDRTTDVLSFLYDASPRAGDPGPHAEIYVSLPRARQQARERRHALRCELALLTLHGLLHLQGHDHERPAEAQRMRAAEGPHLRWLHRRTGWDHVAPLVPAVATVQG
jgi:probable rRNA maturation factor